ncbi:MAG: DUF2520 domain-containing protein [Bryobacteraceae bacterium]|nr:DUF2520 domain-containing protein [Bryobacteraceae bacterium]
MTKSLQLALVAAGQLRRCPVVRLKNLADHLGPVKAQSFRQASRFSNTLRAGYPVHHYSDLAHSRIILFCAPDRKGLSMLPELEAAHIDWSRKVVLLCAGNHDSGILSGFAARGAAVGSLHSVGGPQQARYFIEGERRAVRAAKTLVAGSGGQALEVQAGSWGLCSAGVTLATTLLVTTMHGSAQCLRRAGLSSREAAAVVGSLAQWSVRGYLKAGPRACRLPQTPEERYVFRQRLESLARTDPALGAVFAELGRLALKSQGQAAAWLDEPPLRVYHASASRG